jgi:hypothetical protein
LQDGFRSNDIADMTAGSLSTLFSWAALICTLAGAISTGVALHYRNVSSKEKDFEIASIGLEAAKSNAEAAKAHERIADLSTQAERLRKDAAEANAMLGAAQADIARANAEIATANQRTAEFGTRTKEAELKLEQLRRLAGPRSLNHDILVKELEGKPKPHAVEIWYLADASDGWWFAQAILSGLIVAGWPVGIPVPIPEPDSNDFFKRSQPRAMAAGGQPSGLSVVVNLTPQQFLDTSADDTPISALRLALAKATGAVVFSSGVGSAVPEGVLRIIIAAKPDPLFDFAPEAQPVEAK